MGWALPEIFTGLERSHDLQCTRGKLSLPHRVSGELMNKTDIIELVASEMDCSKVQAGKAVEAVIKSLRDGILDDGGVTITGFGRF